MKPTYNDLAEFIAAWVLDNLYREERLQDGTTVKLIDNECCTAYQMATGVLARLNVLTTTDTINRRHRLACAPEEMASMILRHRDAGCAYSTLVLTLASLLRQCPFDDGLFDRVAGLGLCRRGKDGDDGIVWTARGESYRDLPDDWPRLLDA